LEWTEYRSSGSTIPLTERTFLTFSKCTRNSGICIFSWTGQGSTKRRTAVIGYIRKNRETLRVRWFPVASPEFDAVEECWRQAEKDLLALPVFPLSPGDLKEFLAKYFRTRRFGLDMKKFLLTEKCL
jgi:hypothetical protein